MSDLLPPGSIERKPNEALTFSCPIHDLLRDKRISQTGPRRFRVVADDRVEIYMHKRLEIVLTPGAEFFSLTWDWNQPVHECAFDFSVRG